LDQGTAGAAQIVNIATVNRRDAMAARSQCRGGVRGRAATDRSGAQSGGAVLECYRAGGTSGHRAGERDAGPINGGRRGRAQDCGARRPVHRLGQGTAGTAGIIAITTVNRCDAMGSITHGRGRVCGRGTTDGASAQGAAAVLERHRAGGAIGHRGGERDAGTIQSRICGTGETGVGTCLVHRLGQATAGAAGIVAITTINRRDAVVATSEGRGCVRGCGATDGAGAQSGATILERHCTGNAIGHRGSKGDAGAIGIRICGTGETGVGTCLVHRLAQGAASAASVVTIATVNRRDAMATRSQGRGRVRGRGATNGAGAQRGAAILERHRAGGTTGHRASKGDAGSVGCSGGRGCQSGCAGRQVHRLGQGAAGAASVVTIATVNRRDAMATRSQCRGGVRGCGTTDGAGAQRGAAILERHRAGGTTGHSGGEGNT